ncbi:hypothetical protein B0H63DRAFT_61287 [Podospora didyma]|uniref:Uncharacterized protein n=1 Tax=Podospora didyma TaxID=330526 RepID=A0AAE0P7P6_9PEZI|nr:hypothetical protein B0H63DRAFT_61287 [Podospora didyma]
MTSGYPPASRGKCLAITTPCELLRLAAVSSDMLYCACPLAAEAAHLALLARLATCRTLQALAGAPPAGPRTRARGLLKLDIQIFSILLIDCVRLWGRNEHSRDGFLGCWPPMVRRVCSGRSLINLTLSRLGNPQYLNPPKRLSPLTSWPALHPSPEKEPMSPTCRTVPAERLRRRVSFLDVS